MESIALDANDEVMCVDLRSHLTPEPPIALKSMLVKIFRMSILTLKMTCLTG